MRRALGLVVVAWLAHCGAEIQGDGGKEPPPRPASTCAPGVTIETFAIDSIDLGESDWQTLGYDLDGKLTTKDSVDVCTQHPGAPHTNQEDGDQGIDNAFGSVLVPMLEGTLQDPQLSTALTSAIDAGRFTLQIQVTGLDDTPTETCTGLRGQIFASDRFDPNGGVPAFDETTDWPVMAESLVDPSDISKGSKTHFDEAYVQNGTVVLGAKEAVTVPIHLVLDSGKSLDLLVHDALVTFVHATAPEATTGVLAGELDPQELITGIEYAFPPCCDEWCSYADQIRQADDILDDLTNTPGVPCDAISFAIGFHARRVANPTKAAAPLPTPPPPCP